MTLAADTSQDLRSASWRPGKADGRAVPVRKSTGRASVSFQTEDRKKTEASDQGRQARVFPCSWDIVYGCFHDIIVLVKRLQQRPSGLQTLEQLLSGPSLGIPGDSDGE